MTRRKDLSGAERQAIALFLLQNSSNGKLHYGTAKAAMEKWGCCRSSIARLWKAAKEEHAQVCRPLFDEDGSVLFDGKIWIFPFTDMVPAKRKSKNREAGTLEEKPIQSITKQVMKDMYIYKLIPAIMAKWPQFASKTIYIHQDNAKPHIKDDDPDFRAAASANGFDIRIIHQPPNSPDTNINDLGWFRAIQSLQVQAVSSNETELVQAVQKSFEELSAVTLNNVFLSLQGCYTEIMKVKGQNCYKIPHMKKGMLARQGNLPMALEVPKELVQ
ncbi:uncharacterized protein LOC131023534 [Salvia miltiorrhiza]|uniref:uncharacterized protein LOC131023534 n=1 Tax=Salvia miltiorrhiza TaxID=226208 RepID=UPI0025AD5DE1|nr:uncharacterized protein LOC131023534 [Salvia miltiorrhiza]